MLQSHPAAPSQSAFVARLLARDREVVELARHTLARWQRGQFIGIRETRAAVFQRLERRSPCRPAPSASGCQARETCDVHRPLLSDTKGGCS